jgi:hypothetical protein
VEGGALCCIIILVHIRRKFEIICENVTGRFKDSCICNNDFNIFFYSPNIIRVCKRVNEEGGGWRRVRYNCNIHLKTVSCTANFQCDDEQWVFWLRRLFVMESLQGS